MRKIRIIALVVALVLGGAASLTTVSHLHQGCLDGATSVTVTFFSGASVTSRCN